MRVSESLARLIYLSLESTIAPALLQVSEEPLITRQNSLQNTLLTLHRFGLYYSDLR